MNANKPILVKTFSERILFYLYVTIQQQIFCDFLLLFHSDSELRLQKTEQRALKAEEDLQAAMEKILELEKQLKGRPSLESKSDDGKDFTLYHRW